MMLLAVIGATGYAGSAVVKELTALPALARPCDDALPPFLLNVR